MIGFFFALEDYFTPMIPVTSDWTKPIRCITPSDEADEVTEIVFPSIDYFFDQIQYLYIEDYSEVSLMQHKAITEPGLYIHAGSTWVHLATQIQYMTIIVKQAEMVYKALPNLANFEYNEDEFEDTEGYFDDILEDMFDDDDYDDDDYDDDEDEDDDDVW